jgi:eukaryotic-like serine/threonine-protein kinase
MAFRHGSAARRQPTPTCDAVMFGHGPARRGPEPLARSLELQGGGARIVSVEKDPSLKPGTLLGGVYRILGRRGTGGMGEVYVASHVRWSGLFAVKVLNPRLQEDPIALARFAQEAEMLALVQHSNVVRLIEYRSFGSQPPFLAMEYLEGSDLAQHLANHGPMAPRRVAVLVAQIAAALEVAHTRRIVHADIKPGNVFLLAGARHASKVLDFGVAHFFGQRPSLVTPAYMAPEQAVGDGEAIDSRTDQFALAALSYVLLTGEDPFPGDRTADVLECILHGRPLATAGRMAWPAEEVEAVLDRALSRRPADRFRTVSEFATQLERAAIAADRPMERLSCAKAERGVSGSARKWKSRTLQRADGRSADGNIVAAARLGCQTTVPARRSRARHLAG